MSKVIKRAILTIIIMIISLVALQTASHAIRLDFGRLTVKGGNINFEWQGADCVIGAPGNNTFCVDHTKNQNRIKEYGILHYIHIDKNDATVYDGNWNDEAHKITTIHGTENGTLAWILAQHQNGAHTVEGSNDLKQKAVWAYFPIWKNLFNGITTMRNFVANSGGATNDEWIREGQNYAQTVENSQPVVLEKNETNPQVETYQAENGEELIKVGPYSLTMSDRAVLQYVKVYDQDNQEVQAQYARYEGDKLVISQAPIEIIRNQTPFYILLPEDKGIEKISKVDLKVEEQRQNIVADVWLLQTNDATFQNFITTDAQATTEPASAELSLSGIELLGKLNLVKVNKDNHEVKLANVSFKFKNSKSGKWIAEDNDGKIKYVDNESDAKVYKTDENGKITIENVIIGTYTAYEQEGNPNYGYEVPSDGKPVKVTVEGEEQLVENKQIKIKLSGFVWVDEPIESKKAGVRNDKYNDGEYDINDTLLEGIKVKLKLKGENGEPDTVEQETVTGEGGSYLFEDVYIEKLDRYYIEFEYNGLIYTNVIPWNKLEGDGLDSAPNVSKAAENEATRNEFNNNFSAIEGDDPVKNTGVIKYKSGEIYDSLEYTRGEGDDLHKSFFNYEGHDFPIHAETTETGYNIKKQFKWGMEEIQYINLGLYKREQADLSLQKDIQNARVAIKGYEHTYNYENRYRNAGDYEEGFNVGVKFSDDRGTSRYTRAIYKSDAVWENPDNRSDELQVGVTYHIRLINEATTVNAKVNRIVDYFDKNYNIAETGAVGTEVDPQTGEVKGTENISYTLGEEIGDTGYKSLTIIPSDEMINSININEESAEDSESDVKAARSETKNYQDIYVYFTMDRQQVKDIAMLDDNEPEEDKILDNIAEIASYSTFDQNGNLYAAIDEDSAPGNIILGDENTYEDDTDIAPEFILRIGTGDDDERQIKGNVFEDLDEDELDNLLRENGIYDDGENPVEGVHVSLVEIIVNPEGNEEVVQEYTQSVDIDGNPTGDEWASGADGSYTIKGFVPGIYKIKFTWGNGKGVIHDLTTGEDIIVDTRDYKSTTQPEAEWNRKGNDHSWYKNEVDTRYSDAIDDWATRTTIDESTKEIVYGNIVNETDPTTSPEMYSYTQPMELTVELEDYENGATIVDRLEGENANVTVNDGNGKDVYLMYVIENVDFGIIGRPIQDIELTKRVESIKYILPTGQTIIEAEVIEDENGNRKLKEDVPGLTYIPSADPTKQGMLRLEVDSELMHGSTLEVTYDFTARNKGQIDYVDERWYNFNDVNPQDIDPSKIVTLSATEVIDYLDKDWGYDMEKNPGWEEITVEDMRNKDLNGAAYFSSEVLDENLTDNEIAERRILLTENLKQRLAPEGNPSGVLSSNSIKLYVSKVVSTQDDIDLGNETEIVHVTKETNEGDPGNGSPGGRRITSTPGSYVPGSSEVEADSSVSENVVVTLPSGDNTIINYIIYTTVGIIALAIFGAGVVIIKKKALKK